MRTMLSSSVKTDDPRFPSFLPRIFSNSVFTLPRNVTSERGFTLIELLVVISILAILMMVVLITVNPIELLKQSRDTNRLSDLQSMRSAIDLFMADTAGTKSLGTSTITYLSLIDPNATTTAGTDCSGLGFPGGGSFHCAASSTATRSDGTGWLPINLTQISSGNPISSLPKDPINSSSSYYAYATDGTYYKISATPESQKNTSNFSNFSQGSSIALQGSFPQGWVKVPGNATFGTNDFYVMKYDAKCADSKGTPLTSPTESTYLTYQNNYDTTSSPCIATNGKQVVSTPDGYPITEISQTSAITYCKNIGAHLITNNEWQTIAWNAENQASNWNGGVVGTSYIYSGHNDNAPANALQASSDDTNGYYLTNNTSPSTQKRTLTLSNGQIIWDMAGNIWQWTNDTILGKNEPTGATPGWNWRSFSTADDGSGNGGITTWGGMTQTSAGPSNSAWNASNGIGRIFSDGTGTNNSTYSFLRGGGWGNGSYAGVEPLALGLGSGNLDINIGFRCAR